MATTKLQIVIFAILFVGLTYSMPMPGGHGGKHTHFIIKVPHFYHEHKHTHTKKIYIPVKSHGGGHHGHSSYEAE